MSLKKGSSDYNPLFNNWAECEYIDVCTFSLTGCEAKNGKENCGLWRDWKKLDLEELFRETVDENKNYLLKF